MPRSPSGRPIVSAAFEPPMSAGYEVMTAGQAIRPELMLAYLIWIGIVGFALNAALVFAQNRLFGEAGRVEAVQ